MTGKMACVKELIRKKNVKTQNTEKKFASFGALGELGYSGGSLRLLLCLVAWLFSWLELLTLTLSFKLDCGVVARMSSSPGGLRAYGVST